MGDSNIRYADIIIDISHEALDKVFQYRVPLSLWEEVQPGSRVFVPFGRGNRETEGYVIAIRQEADYEESKIKEILRVNTEGISVESELIQVASFFKEKYGSTMIQALRTVLPVKTKMKPKEEVFITLSIEKDTAQQLLCEWERKHFAARARFLSTLLKKERMRKEEAVKTCNFPLKELRKLSEQGIIKLESRIKYRNPFPELVTRKQGWPLNDEQRAIVDNFKEEYRKGERRTYLLYGITGSGKTEVYLSLINEVLAVGRQVIVLIPEISLTYQTVRRFYERFGERIAVINSRMSKGEKSDACERIRAGEADVIISFEKLEAARWLEFLKKDGTIITNTQEVEPMPVITGAAAYPENLIEKMQAAGAKVDAKDFLLIAQEAGSAKAVNIALMGRLSTYFPEISDEQWQDAIEKIVPPKFLDLNRKAFEAGRNA